MRPQATRAVALLAVLVLLPLLVVPSAAASDVSIPDPSPVTDAASDHAGALAEDTVSFHQGNVGHAFAAANEVQFFVLPMSRLAGIVEGSGAYAQGRVAAALALAMDASSWTADELEAKLREAGDLTLGADQSTAAVLRAAGAIALAAVDAACGAPVSPADPSCDPGSLAHDAAALALGVGNQAAAAVHRAASEGLGSANGACHGWAAALGTGALGAEPCP